MFFSISSLFFFWLTLDLSAFNYFEVRVNREGGREGEKKEKEQEGETERRRERERERTLVCWFTSRYPHDGGWASQAGPGNTIVLCYMNGRYLVGS